MMMTIVLTTKKSDLVLLSNKERNESLLTCRNILEDNEVTIAAHKFRTKEDFEREIIKQAYAIRSKNDQT